MSTYKITIENYQGSVEQHYFLVVDILHEFGFKTIKTKDTFNSSITSSFWGSIEQRRTLQQEKASQFMGVIAQMVKSMFQILRSLRIMDERLEYYHQAKHGPDKRSAEIALKGIWIDMVEGAGKNPSSVYGLATQVGFTTLPDLFFDICPKNSSDLKKKMSELEKSGLNRKIIEVLQRKIFQYMTWRDATEKEMKSSRGFHLAYLRQHFNTIRMYLDWIRPYLKNINRLSQKSSRSEDILEMADTAIADIELFAWLGEDKFKKFLPTIKVTIEYRTVPELVYQQEYQKGPIHIGRTRISFEGKAMLINEIREMFRKDYLKDIKLLEDMFASMGALGDDLVKYLKEAHEEDPSRKLGIKLEKGKVKPPKGIVAVFGPFKDIGKGFVELFGAFRPKKKAGENKALVSYDMPQEIENIWKKRDKELEKMRGRQRRRFKTREDFETDEAFDKYLKDSKRKLTKLEENELEAVKEIVDKKKKDRVWDIYDVFKKQNQLVRW